MKTINGLIFGNDKKQCLAEAKRQCEVFGTFQHLNYFVKVKGKDLFEYSITIKLL